MLESLERRELMAVGPQLIGAQPNNSELFNFDQGAVNIRSVSPQEITFRFDDEQIMRPSTFGSPTELGGIQITRAGLDGEFEAASVTSDFNTAGAVQLKFTARRLGADQNGISLQVTKSNQGAAGLPTVTVVGNTIAVVLNTNANNQSTALDLLNALNAEDSPASALITAEILSGSPDTVLANRTINFSPLVLGGEATVTTDLNTANGVQVKLTSVRYEGKETGLQVNVTKSNHGGIVGAPVAPIVSVVDKTINVDLNTDFRNPSTAQDFVNAINSDPEASQLIRAEIVSGSAATNVAQPAINYSPLKLGGVSNDIVVNPGYIGRLANPDENEVVFRFSETLADDLYRVDIYGDHPVLALRNEATVSYNVRGRIFNGFAFGDTTDDGVDNGEDFSFEFELDLGPQIVSVVPQPLRRNAAGVMEQARDEVMVYFNNDDLDQASAENVDFYQLILTRDTVENTDDVVFHPTSVSYDPITDTAVLTFADNLDELVDPATGLPIGSGTFRLRIGTDEQTPAPPVHLDLAARVVSDLGTGGAVQVLFETDLVTADEFGSAMQVIVTSSDHSQTGDPAGPKIDVRDNIIRVDLDNTPGNETTAQELVDALNAEPRSAALLTASIANGNAATIVADEFLDLQPIELVGVGSSFDTASPLGVLAERTPDPLNPGQTVLGPTSVIVASRIDPQVYKLEYPGSNDEPGHRSVQDVGSHVGAADSDEGITEIEYNFRTNIGSVLDLQGVPQPSFNVITEQQKERAREALQVLSRSTGIEFVETDNSGVTIATGALNTSPFGPTVMLDSGANWDDQYGENWFQMMMTSVIRWLGVVGSGELPPGTLMAGTSLLGTTTTGRPPVAYDPLTNSTRATLVPTGTAFGDPDLLFNNPLEPVFPGDHDIVHLNYMYRPESKDIDLYQFEVQETGLFTAETIAERKRESSSLDTEISLYREDPIRDSAGNIILDSMGLPLIERTLISRNDNYFSNDSYLEMVLEPGQYFIAVAASGNSNFDPVIEDSGIGGKTEGLYDLRLNFRPDAVNSIIDADNVGRTEAPAAAQATALDGDTNGVPGGVYNFWFQTRPVERQLNFAGDGTLFVDGQTIRLVDNEGVTRVFELDSNNRLSTSGNNVTRIAFSASTINPTSAMTVATTVEQAINAAGFGVKASLTRELQFTGDGSTMTDGESITVRDRFGASHTFELDLNNAAINPNNPTLIPFVGASADELATSLADAINAAGLQVQATAVGDKVVIDGATDVSETGANVVVTNTTALTLYGERSVTLSATGRGVTTTGRTIFV
ncbi:MAG: hypothetical protein KDA62_07185, partial [Planctomycetales bacterium]|nr:hypothetical protein [Planctomycetales bacterium]